MARAVSVQAELNIHQAIKAIIAFAKESFGDTNGWLTENEAIDLVAAAETILQNVTRAKVPVISKQNRCDRCGEPVEIRSGVYTHADAQGWAAKTGPFRDGHYARVYGKDMP